MQARNWTAWVCVLVGSVAAAQTTEEIVARNNLARGGAEKIRATASMRLSGTFMLGGRSSPITVRAKRPNKIREDFQIAGKSVTRAYDGSDGWQEMEESGGAQVLNGGSLENIREEAENAIEGPLLDYAKKGNKVEFTGKDAVDGKPCYKLRITLKSGTVITQYLDADSFLEIHEEIERDVNGRHTVIIEGVSDYREVNGIKLAHRFVSGTKEDPSHSILQLQKFELNAPVEDAVFAKPK